MPEINGLDLLAEMNERRVSMPVIIMTGQGNAQLVVAAMIQGAFDFREPLLAFTNAAQFVMPRQSGEAKPKKAEF